MAQTQHSKEQAPDWLLKLIDKGFEPYIATARHLLPHLNTTPFGQKAKIYLMDEVENSSFLEAYFMLEAYLLSNSLGFESPNYKMPNWVLIDCVLMQTAVVGFTAAKSVLPDELLDYYRADERIELDKLQRIPISGQISSPNIGAKSMMGISLFSLGRRWLNNEKNLGLYTKTMSLEVYNAKNYDCYFGIAQYDNPSLKIHGQFGHEIEIDQPMVPLHPGKDMTYIYKMKIDYDPYHPGKKITDVKPDFWLNARDIDKKREMQEGIRKGKKYVIVPPFWVKRDDGIFLPIVEKKA